MIFSLISCGTCKVSPEIIGHWKSGETQVTIRHKENGDFHFTKGTAIADIIIDQNKLAHGQIGNAKFVNAPISPNWGVPTDMSGIKYIIKCELQGKIFPSAPVE